MNSVVKNDVIIDEAYSKFIRNVIELDKARWTEINQDSVLLEQFADSNIEDRLKMFSGDFQKQVKQLYTSFTAYNKAGNELAACVYELHKNTGATYEAIAKLLETSFGREVDKSYICKLAKAGEVVAKNPTLSVVKDVEKLSSLGRIPDLFDKLTVSADGEPMLFGINLATASRKEVSEKVKEVLPVNNNVKYVTPSVALPTFNIADFKSILQYSLVNIDGDLKAAVELAISLIL